MSQWFFLSHFQILQKLRFQCLYFGIFFLHASLRKLKLIIFWLIIMFIFILLIWLYLWFQFEWTRRCVCAGAEWAVCGGPGVSAGPCFSFPQCALALRRRALAVIPPVSGGWSHGIHTNSIECIFRSGNHFDTASKSRVFISCKSSAFIHSTAILSDIILVEIICIESIVSLFHYRWRINGSHFLNLLSTIHY